MGADIEKGIPFVIVNSIFGKEWVEFTLQMEGYLKFEKNAKNTCQMLQGML